MEHKIEIKRWQKVEQRVKHKIEHKIEKIFKRNGYTTEIEIKWYKNRTLNGHKESEERERDKNTNKTNEFWAIKGKNWNNSESKI